LETTTSPSKTSTSASNGPNDALLAAANHAEIARALRETDDDTARRAVLVATLPWGDTDVFLAFLKAEAVRYFAINSHTSLRLAEALIAAAELSDRPEARILGVLSRADALGSLGRYAEAAALYEQAREAFRVRGDDVGWARTFTNWIYAMHYLGRATEALERVGAAYDTFARCEEWLLAARLDQNTGVVHAYLGRYNEALWYYDRAQRAFEQLAVAGEEGAARAKLNKAAALTRLGAFRDALALHEDARAVFVRRGATRIVHSHDREIGILYMTQGDYTRALGLYRDALAALEREKQDTEAARVALAMVECYLGLNFHTEALALAEETIDRVTRDGSPTETARAQFVCALACERLGQRERALALLQAAAHTFYTTGLTTDAGFATLLRARLYLGERDWAGAIREATDAGALFGARGLIVYETQADLIRARALLGTGETGAVMIQMRDVRARVREHELSWLAAECHSILADIARMRGDDRSALRESRTAIAGIERAQSRLAVELRSHFLQDKLGVYHDAIGSCLRLGDGAQAFGLLERAKSRTLVDYLARHPDVRVHAPDAADQALLDELHRLRAEHHWLYNRLFGFDAADGESATQEAVRDRERCITQILERLALHRAGGGEAFHALLPMPTADTPTLPPLDAGAVLLEYYLHPDGGAVFVVAGGELRVIPLPASPHAIEQLLRRWQINLDATARAVAGGQPLTGLAHNARGILQALYRALIAPVAPLLDAMPEGEHGERRLVIVPYGAAHAVPFHALHDGARYLIERGEVVTCLSSALLQSCNARAARTVTDGNGRALVMAYSDNGQLPHVLDEARAVTSLLPGTCLVEEQATRDALIAAAPRHHILHLAAHGEARLDNPTFAHLRLADGQLSASDVFNLALDGALVTLSACETGRATVVGGDELVGLSRGFLFAGAVTLVQSLWRVEDASTARLMTHFYHALRAGQHRGAALREAQLALLHEGGHAGHPYFWAPFQLVGASGVLA